VDSTGTTQYFWDFENRLKSVTLPGSGGTVTFKYDPFGRRTYKSSSGGTSVFAYDGDNLLEETNSSGTVVARYEDTQNIDEPLAMLRSSATSYYHADGLGSVTSLSNSSGSIANTYTYDSYGKLTASTGSLVRSLGTALAEAPGHRRSHRGSVRGRQCAGISVSRRCGAVSPRLAGAPATVRTGVAPGQDAPGRVQALRRREPKAAW